MMELEDAATAGTNCGGSSTTKNSSRWKRMGFEWKKLWKKHSANITEYDPSAKVVYLGNVLTGWAKGDGCLEKPLSTLWRNYCGSNRTDVHMRVTVCASGLKATTEEHGLTEYWAHRITWCSAPQAYPRLFAWVYRHEGRRLKQELRCHAVLCTSSRQARQLANRLAERLKEALYDFRREKLCKQAARLSLVNCDYDDPHAAIPRRRVLLASGNNYRPPLERCKSAPRLGAIEESPDEEQCEDLPTAGPSGCQTSFLSGLHFRSNIGAIAKGNGYIPRSRSFPLTPIPEDIGHPLADDVSPASTPSDSSTHFEAPSTHVTPLPPSKPSRPSTPPPVGLDALPVLPDSTSKVAAWEVTAPTRPILRRASQPGGKTVWAEPIPFPRKRRNSATARLSHAPHATPPATNGPSLQCGLMNSLEEDMQHFRIDSALDLDPEEPDSLSDSPPSSAGHSPIAFLRCNRPKRLQDQEDQDNISDESGYSEEKDLGSNSSTGSDLATPPSVRDPQRMTASVASQFCEEFTLNL